MRPCGGPTKATDWIFRASSALISASVRCAAAGSAGPAGAAGAARAAAAAAAAPPPPLMLAGPPAAAAPSCLAPSAGCCCGCTFSGSQWSPQLHPAASPYTCSAEPSAQGWQRRAHKYEAMKHAAAAAGLRQVGGAPYQQAAGCKRLTGMSATRHGSALQLPELAGARRKARRLCKPQAAGSDCSVDSLATCKECKNSAEVWERPGTLRGLSLQVACVCRARWSARWKRRNKRNPRRPNRAANLLAAAGGGATARHSRRGRAWERRRERTLLAPSQGQKSCSTSQGTSGYESPLQAALHCSRRGCSLQGGTFGLAALVTGWRISWAALLPQAPMIALQC